MKTRYAYVKKGAKSVPIRYRGRWAKVIDTITDSRGRERVVLDFSPRRSTPLEISARFVTFES